MDRSFLSDASVVKASRDFVCIRLATYEDAAEAEFMKKIFLSPQSGTLENTTFALLKPDGKEKLSRAGRGPHFAFWTADAMADSMRSLTRDRYPESPQRRYTDTELPYAKNVDVGLNIAACDSSLAIVVFGESTAQVRDIEQRLLPVAWSEEFAGQFIYALATSAKGLKPIAGRKGSAGILVVEPGDFGMSATVREELADDFDSESLQQSLRRILADFQPPIKDSRQHIQQGAALGIEWKTEIPVTDQMSLRAMERGLP